MKLPRIPALKFEGKAVLVLEDGRQYGSHPLGFVEKCPLIAIGEVFPLPSGESAGTITEVDFGYADNALVASCSFTTDKFPFHFKVHADAREVATYYQRTWRRRFEKDRTFIHRLKIEVSEGFPYRKRGAREEVLYPVYETIEKYTRETFATFLRNYRRGVESGRTVALYGKLYKVKGCSWNDEEAGTTIVLPENEAKVLRETSKKRWDMHYRDAHGRVFPGKPKRSRKRKNK